MNATPTPVIGSAPPDFLLSVEALTVSFDGFKAVDDLSFYVDEHEIRVIIGPNGAGKTTVLDLICGKTKRQRGSIKFRGQELTRMSEIKIVRAGVGRKFQTPVDLRRSDGLREPGDFLSAGRSVFGALAFKRDAAVIDRVREIAEMIFLEDQLKERAEFL